MKKNLYFLLLFCICSLSTYAQVDNSLWSNDIVLSESKEKGFDLNVYNFNYMRNYEYFNKTADGLTYFGSILQPELVYRASSNLTLSGGLFLRKDYGTSGWHSNEPVFSINFHPGKWQIIAGRLNGNASHGLPEPLYNYDRIITNPLEFGNQFIYTDSSFKMDAWINWEHMIYKVSPVQEVISGGISANKKLINSDKWSLNLPFGFVAFHKGGQIDTPDRDLITILNTDIGLETKFRYNGKPDHYIWADAHFLTYRDFSFTKANPFNDGWGFMANLGWKFGTSGLSFTYWKANEFITTHGAPLYRSVSDQMNNPGYTDADRNLLFIRLVSDYPITPHFYISARLEPYFDLDNPQFEFSNSLFLVYKESFDLRRKR